MTAYYNEIDPYAAQWLRNLIEAGHIAAGVVDERSIEDVTPGDLRGFAQCHFFAGIGVWSYALRQAGWSDDRPVWTGSCPCQPFSAAGKGNGFDDERHLWPAFQWLIEKCRPEHVFGEQVAAGNANAWFDLVQTDMEGMGYAFGLTPFTSASIGAPNIRERAYWVAHANMQCESSARNAPGASERIRSCTTDGMADAGGERFYGIDPLLQRKEPGRISEDMPQATGQCVVERMANTSGIGNNEYNHCANECGWKGQNEQNRMGCCIGGLGDSDIPGLERLIGNDSAARREGEIRSASSPGIHSRPLEVNGFWRDADWLFCRDGQWRPVESGTFPLVARFAKGLGHGKSSLRAMAGRNRTGRLKGYGNAINAEAAKYFILACMEA